MVPEPYESSVKAVNKTTGATRIVIVINTHKTVVSLTNDSIE